LCTQKYRPSVQVVYSSTVHEAKEVDVNAKNKLKESKNKAVEKGESNENKSKIIKFKVAGNMRCAAEKVLEKVVSKVNWNLSKNIEWFKGKSEWDLVWEYSGSHIFEEVIMDYVKKNWKSDPFPASLIKTWTD
jgi:hypothetical protein